MPNKNCICATMSEATVWALIWIIVKELRPKNTGTVALFRILDKFAVLGWLTGEGVTAGFWTNSLCTRYNLGHSSRNIILCICVNTISSSCKAVTKARMSNRATFQKRTYVVILLRACRAWTMFVRNQAVFALDEVAHQLRLSRCWLILGQCFHRGNRRQLFPGWYLMLGSERYCRVAWLTW